MYTYMYIVERVIRVNSGVNKHICLTIRQLFMCMHMCVRMCTETGNQHRGHGCQSSVGQAVYIR